MPGGLCFLCPNKSLNMTLLVEIYCALFILYINFFFSHNVKTKNKTLLANKKAKLSLTVGMQLRVNFFFSNTACSFKLNLTYITKGQSPLSDFLSARPQRKSSIKLNSQAIAANRSNCVIYYKKNNDRWRPRA